MAKNNAWRYVVDFLSPTSGGAAVPLQDQRNLPKVVNNNLSRYISPVQLSRIRQDFQSWREGVTEAENVWYPHRVKQQRLYNDTVLNGHVFSCMDQREKMTMLKPYNICAPSGEDGKPGNPDTKLTKLIQTKWFRDYMRYALQAQAFGYSLIYLGDLIQDAFPKLSIIRRFNISPDRLNVTQFVYSISGAPFTEAPYADWHIWVDTPTDVGTTTCGFGYLYKVALYEIVARNVLGFNTDATEMYGMPIRVGKTSKSEESVERAIFEQALASLGSAGYILMDMVGDDIELMESKSLGNGYKIYESLESRCEKKISKIILGHADAVDSVPGKLGKQDEKDSPVNKAKAAIQATDMDFITDLTNNQLFPKLRNLGFPIPEGYQFVFTNDDEMKEQRDAEDKSNKMTADIFAVIKNAGGDPDWNYFSERTGIKVIKTEQMDPLTGKPLVPGAVPGKEDKTKIEPKKKVGVNPKIKAKLEEIYTHDHHSHE